jgi:hypothetical protein
MLLNRMQPVPDGFACASCSCKTVDFRGKSSTEIQASLTDGVCGIFTEDQLPHQRQLVGRARLAFRFAVVLSFLGFNVKPVAAAEGPLVHAGPNQVETSLSEETDHEKPRLHRGGWKHRLKFWRKRRTVRGKLVGQPHPAFANQLSVVEARLENGENLN